MATVKQRRTATLKREGFTPAEAQVISQFAFNLPYINELRKDRRELVRDVLKLKLNKTQSIIELRKQIELIYQINGWQDAWAMTRDYRQRGIDRGEYTPPPRKPRKPIDKGNITMQRRRYRARKTAEIQGRTGVQFDSEDNVIGWVEYNPETGRFESRNA